MAPARYTQWGGTAGEREADGLALYDDIHMTAASFHSRCYSLCDRNVEIE